MILTDIAPNGTTVDPILSAAQSAAGQGDYAAALQAVLPFVQQLPLNPGYLDVALTCYWHLGDTGTALQLLQVLIETAPEDRTVWGKLGAMLLSMGEQDGAAAAFEHCLTLAPRSVTALGALNMIRRFEKGSHRARMLRDLAKAPGTSAFDQAVAWNGVGRIEEAWGTPRVAFRCFEKSNQAQPARHNAAAFDALVAAQEELFQPVADSAPEGPRCIFVVGLPRSGTTLVEKILTRHPMVRTTGEGAQLQHVLSGVRRQFAGDGGPWDWAKLASPDDLRRAREVFYRRIEVAPELTRPFVMNKLPLGCFDMGFAQMLLPGARFIFMARHPLDVGLSNFCTHFYEAHPFAKTLVGIAHMTRAVYRSLDDYIPKLGAALRVQSYAHLVAEPDPQIRALLAHVGLPWDEACLTPETGGGAVRTASVMQVREAINTKGLGKWERYGDQLGPLIDALDVDWLDDWLIKDARRGR